MLKFNIKSTLLAVVFGLVASPALAQEVPEHGVYILNSLLFKSVSSEVGTYF